MKTTHSRNRIVVFGDLHFPFHSERALKEALYISKQFKPTHVVQIGDLYDQYSFSRFTRKNILLPEQELEAGVNAAREMWRGIRSSSPRSKCYQILGNHDVRLLKRATERLPEAQELVKKSVLELYQFKGVTTIEDDRETLVIDGVVYHHGFKSRAGDHMRHFSARTVVGHSHVGGVVFEQRDGEVLWELNAGYLADETAEPLRYRPTTTSKWTTGLGVIDEYGPRFIPLCH